MGGESVEGGLMEQERRANRRWGAWRRWEARMLSTGGEMASGVGSFPPLEEEGRWPQNAGGLVEVVVRR